MKIGIIGSGIVGQVLAKSFTAEGNEVMLGTRNTAKEDIVKFKSANPSISIGNFKETAEYGEILVIATKGSVTTAAIEIAGIENFSGKPVNGVLQFFTGPNESLLEKLQSLLPKAKLVKAFNSVGNAVMYKPHFSAGQPTMFIAGNDEEAKKFVTSILTAFGWATEDMGKMEAARAIEPLCMLWCIPGFLRNEWSHAFSLLKK